jgi:septal ring factor EnvC (AmiA/AmiB activator)
MLNWAKEAVKEAIEPKLQIGTIVIILMNGIFAGAWLLNDHQISTDLKAANERINASLDQIKMQLPLTTKDIEFNGKRITALETQQAQIQSEIEQLKEQTALIQAQIEDISQETQKGHDHH